MAKVVWSNGIDYVSGALNKVKGGQHDHEKMLLGTHRKAATTSTHCNRIYLREKPQRRTQPSSRELSARERFTDVRAMVYARKRDLMKISQDQMDFLAQRNLAGGKKTMNAYLWYVCGQEYDAQHS